MADDPTVEVEVQEEFAATVSEDLVARVSRAALARARQAGPDRLTVLIADDDTLRSLNRDFLGNDEVTDVLSFPAREGWHEGVPPADDEDDAFPLPPGEEERLGDIAISCPQAARQAQAAGTPLERELALLVAHGVLHLLGFDHAEPQGEAAMSAMTRSILMEIFGP